jgi:hypothetical protein
MSNLPKLPSMKLPNINDHIRMSKEIDDAVATWRKCGLNDAEVEKLKLGMEQLRDVILSVDNELEALNAFCAGFVGAKFGVDPINPQRRN